MSRHIQRPFSGLPTPESLAAGQEFTDRDPQWPATREYLNPAGEQQAHTALPNTPLGEPPIDVDVRSVYDVRPIQAFDVNIPLLATTAVFKAAEGSNLAVAIVQPVPLGYVFVLRKLSPYFSSAIPPIVYRNDALLTIRKNQGDVPFNVAIPIGADMTDIDTFIIYDEGEQYGARIDLSAITVNFPNSYFGCNFYGNFLRKSGRPAHQEIGNPVKHPQRQTDR